MWRTETFVNRTDFTNSAQSGLYRAYTRGILSVACDVLRILIMLMPVPETQHVVQRKWLVVS